MPNFIELYLESHDAAAIRSSMRQGQESQGSFKITRRKVAGRRKTVQTSVIGAALRAEERRKGRRAFEHQGE
eukprot:6175181-Pleurochrysis_carterae.AAC.2